MTCLRVAPFPTKLKLAESERFILLKQRPDLAVAALNSSPISNLTSLKWLEVGKYIISTRNNPSFRDKKMFAMIQIASKWLR